VLDDLAVFEAEEVRECPARVVGVVGLEVEVGVGGDQVAFRDDAFDVESDVRVLAAQPLDEGDERLRAILGVGVVLDVTGTEVVRDRLLRVPGEGCRLVVDDDLLVALWIRHGADGNFWLLGTST
jgi:hypothetical protein